MNDYCNGIAYASGYFAKEDGKQYLVIRNLDPWYAKVIESESKYKAYASRHNITRDGSPQWCIKARDVSTVPPLSEIQNARDFCRAYIEIHGSIDLATVKDRRGAHYKRPRLRIYGTAEVLSFLNNCLPANEKKIQHVKCKTVDGYVGETCILYYQSTKEIASILQWMNGVPKNEAVWQKWKEIMKIIK